MPTIDDLPIDSHNQYAKNVEQQRREPLQFKEDRQVVGPAQIGVNAPAYPSEIRSLTQEDLCNIRWSDFPALPETLTKRNCFSTDLIPRLGSQEALATLKQRVDNQIAMRKPQEKPAESASKPQDLSRTMKWEEEKMKIEYDNECKVINKLLETLTARNKDLYDINAGRHLFHKG